MANQDLQNLAVTVVPFLMYGVVSKSGPNRDLALSGRQPSRFAKRNGDLLFSHVYRPAPLTGKKSKPYQRMNSVLIDGYTISQVQRSTRSPAARTPP